MDGGGPPPIGKHRAAHGGRRALLYPDLPFAPSSLRMDEHSAGKRSEPRFEAGLFEFEFLHPPRGGISRLLHHRRLPAEKIFGSSGQRRQSAIHDLATESFV